MIHDEIHRMVHRYEDVLSKQGLNLDQFFKMTNSNLDALEEKMKPEALNIVKSRLVIEAIADEEKIEIGDEEASLEAQNMAEKYQMSKDEFLNTFGGLEMVKYDMKMRKTIELLKENN